MLTLYKENSDEEAERFANAAIIWLKKNNKREKAEIYVKKLGFDSLKKLFTLSPYEMDIYSQKKYPDDKIQKKIKDLFSRDLNKSSDFGRYNKKGASINQTIMEYWGMPTCVYCNRNFTGNISGNNPDKITMTAEIDHFHPKKKFPQFMFSFYNLVPSCKVCNKLKRESEKPMHNPHDPYNLRKGESFRIGFELTGAEFPSNHASFEICFKIRKGDLRRDDYGNKVRNQIAVLHLITLYETHKDIVGELIRKQFIFNESYLQELASQYPSIFLSAAMLYQAVFNTYLSGEDLIDRPLSKLIRDVEEQLLGMDHEWTSIYPSTPK